MKEKLLKGHQAGKETSRFTSTLRSPAPFQGIGEEPAGGYLYFFSDNGDLKAMRYDNWK
jgi:hypothetical protein